MDDLFQMNDALDKINTAPASDGEVTELDLSEEDLIFTEDSDEDDEKMTEENPRVSIAYSFVGIPIQVDLEAPEIIESISTSIKPPEDMTEDMTEEVPSFGATVEVPPAPVIEVEAVHAPEPTVIPAAPVVVPAAPAVVPPADIPPPYRQQTLPVKHITDLVTRPEITLNYDSFGETFVSLRKAAGLNLAALSEQTLISVSHLESLEQEDYNNLPPPVYVAAYIRKLGNIYHLSDEEISGLTKKVRERMEYDLPEEMSKVVVKFEQSEENEEKVRHIFIGFTILLILALIALVFGAVLFFTPGKSKEKLSGSVPRAIPEISSFSEGQLLELQSPQTLQTDMLPIPPQRSNRR